MRFKRRTAVRLSRNLLGKRVRGRLSLQQVLALEKLGAPKEAFLDLLDLGYLLPMAGGATVPQNTVLANPQYFPRALAVSTDQTINQGDLCWWDPVNFTLKALANPSQVAVGAAGGFVGAAQGSSVPGVYPNPPAGAPSESLPGVVVQRGGSVRCGSVSGEGNYFPFEPVTIGSDAQTVSRGGQTSTNRVGFIVVPPPVSARSAPGATPVPEVVASGGAVELWLEPKFPNAALL